MTPPNPPPSNVPAMAPSPNDWMRSPWPEGPVNRAVQRWRKKNASTIRYVQECVDWPESGKGSYSTNHGQHQAVARTIRALMFDTAGVHETERRALLYWMGRICAAEPARIYPEDPAARQGRSRTTISHVVSELFDRWARSGWLSVSWSERPVWARGEIEKLCFRGPAEIGPYDNWLPLEPRDRADGGEPINAQRDLKTFLDGYIHQVGIDSTPHAGKQRPEKTKVLHNSRPRWGADAAEDCVFLRILAASTDAVHPEVRASLIQFAQRYNLDEVQADLRQGADALDDRDVLDAVVAVDEEHGESPADVTAQPGNNIRRRVL